MREKKHFHSDKLIADFMGIGEWSPSDGYHPTCNWSQLMPVIDKIESFTGIDGRGIVNYVVTLDTNYCVISLGGEEIIADYQGETRIESAYKAVVKFIECYNQQK